MDKKIEYYQWFFSDQLQQMEIEQKTIINTPIAQLIQQGVVTMGFESSKIIRCRKEKCFLNLWYSYKRMEM